MKVATNVAFANGPMCPLKCKKIKLIESILPPQKNTPRLRARGLTPCLQRTPRRSCCAIAVTRRASCPASRPPCCGTTMSRSWPSWRLPSRPAAATTRCLTPQVQEETVEFSCHCHWILANCVHCVAFACLMFFFISLYCSVYMFRSPVYCTVHVTHFLCVQYFTTCFKC